VVETNLRRDPEADRRVKFPPQIFSEILSAEICGICGKRTMPAAAAATITAPTMIISRENHQTIVEIKIAGQNFGRRAGIFGAMEFHHARAAEAVFIFQLRRNFREQRFGNFHLRAPARTFVSRVGAKLAIVWLPAQRTLRGINYFDRRRIQFYSRS
jgi:hypothetical protein